MTIAHGAQARLKAHVVALALTLVGPPALAAETCSWTRTPSGADFGTCEKALGKTYCVTCQYSPRVCVRTPC